MAKWKTVLAGAYGFAPLRPGRYQWTVYAVARKSTPKYPIFPDDARTAQNVVASRTVVIK